MLILLTQRQQTENQLFPFSEYLVSFEHKFICCAIPKNACTPIKRWFLSVVEPDLDPAVDVHARCRDYYGLHLQAPSAAADLLERFFCFSIIRDPLKRIASAYANKFVEAEPHQLFEPAREVVEENERLHGATAPQDTRAEVLFGDRSVTVPACSAIAYRRGITFREFVNYLRHAPDSHLDIHWRPQTCFLSRGRQWTLGGMDNLHPFLCSIADRLGVPPPPFSARTPMSDLPAQGHYFGDMLSSELNRRRIYPSADMLYDDDTAQTILSRYQPDADLYRSLHENNGVITTDAAVFANAG